MMTERAVKMKKWKTSMKIVNKKMMKKRGVVNGKELSDYDKNL